MERMSTTREGCWVWECCQHRSTLLLGFQLIRRGSYLHVSSPPKGVKRFGEHTRPSRTVPLSFCVCSVPKKLGSDTDLGRDIGQKSCSLIHVRTEDLQLTGNKKTRPP